MSASPSACAAEHPRPAAASSTPPRVFDVAPAEELLYSLSADGKRKFMHPVVHKGRFWKIRRNIAYALMVAFFALPLLRVGGYPAVFFDLASRRTHLFGTTFHPTENLVLLAFGFSVVVTVFFVGSTFGRVWCGFGCPQTVYLEFLFRPIEAWVEGGPARQRGLNSEPWNARKLRIKATKWVLFTLVALVMSANFVAYFTSWSALGPGLLHEPWEWTGSLFTMAALSALIVFDFGWFRDQMCTIACPYGRLQNVLSDKDTLLVAYDTGRGEPVVFLKPWSALVAPPGPIRPPLTNCHASPGLQNPKRSSDIQTMLDMAS